MEKSSMEVGPHISEREANQNNVHSAPKQVYTANCSFNTLHQIQKAYNLSAHM